MTVTIAERLADHVVGLRYDDLPQSVVEQAKKLTAHQLGVALIGRRFEKGGQAVNVALEASGSDGRCSIVGESRRAGLLDAAFAKPTLATCVALVDTLPDGAVPGPVIMPVAWGVGEATNASGRDLLTAIAVGYDVVHRVFPPHFPGPALQGDGLVDSPVWTWEREAPRPLKLISEPFGAAATAARLFGLSRQQAVHALGHAGHMGMGLYEGFEHFWPISHALVARNGALAALLARAGMPAAPTILEGPHGVYRSYLHHDAGDAVEAGLEMLGREFGLSHAEISHYPASKLNQLPIELTRAMVRAHALTPSRIASLDLVLPDDRRAREAVYDSVENTAGPSFVVAIVATDGRLDLDRIAGPPDPELIAMRDKVRLRFESGRSLFYARVEVTTTDGEQYAAEEDQYASPPVGWDDWLSEGGRGILPENRIARLLELVQDLEDVPDVAELMACARPPAHESALAASGV